MSSEGSVSRDVYFVFLGSYRTRRSFDRNGVEVTERMPSSSVYEQLSDPHSLML